MKNRIFALFSALLQLFALSVHASPWPAPGRGPVRPDPRPGNPGRPAPFPGNPGRPDHPGRGRGHSQVGQPLSRGNGCPEGSVSATLSPDESTVSLIFGNYLVEAGRNTGRDEERKFCEISVPVTIPAGYSVIVSRVDYRGFNALPERGMSAFRFKFGLQTNRGRVISDDREQVFRGPLAEEFLLSQEATQFVSGCGETFNLLMSTALRVRTNPNREQAMASVDSADLSTSRDTTKYYLEWRQCTP